jgi:hypothetical protein
MKNDAILASHFFAVVVGPHGDARCRLPFTTSDQDIAIGPGALCVGGCLFTRTLLVFSFAARRDVCFPTGPSDRGRMPSPAAFARLKDGEEEEDHDADGGGAGPDDDDAEDDDEEGDGAGAAAHDSMLDDDDAGDDGAGDRAVDTAKEDDEGGGAPADAAGDGAAPGASSPAASASAASKAPAAGKVASGGASSAAGGVPDEQVGALNDDAAVSRMELEPVGNSPGEDWLWHRRVGAWLRKAQRDQVVTDSEQVS